MRFLIKIIIIFIYLMSCYGLIFNSHTLENIQTIELNKHNFIAIREEINTKVINKVITFFSKITNKNIKYYLVLDTPGGMVEEGNRLIDFLYYLKLNNISIDCIAKKAISMGFAILQNCPGKRLTLPNAILMQHQMHLQLYDNIFNIKTRLYYVNKVYNNMVVQQSNRIKITPALFSQKIHNNWWLDGYQAFDANVVDSLILFGCSRDLFLTNEIILQKAPNPISKCPLI